MSITFLVKKCKTERKLVDLILSQHHVDSLPWVCRTYLGKIIKQYKDAYFWDEMSNFPCYLYMKYTVRFFPIESETLLTTYKEFYPEYEKKKHSNFNLSKRLMLESNYKFVGHHIPEKSNIDIIQDIAKILYNVPLEDELRISLYENIATNPLYYYMIFKSLFKYIDLSTYRNIRKSVFLSSYLFDFNESIAKDVTLDSKFVFNLEEMLNFNKLADFSIDENPLLTAGFTNHRNIYTSCPFYLSGRRQIVNQHELDRRLEYITKGCITTLKQFNNVAVCGSALFECIIDSPLGDFETFDRLYFSNGDIDIVFSSESYKDFLRDAKKLMDSMEEILPGFSIDENICASGVRFHLTHPKLNKKIEIFRTPVSLIKLVSGFHLPCVRMYYNMVQVYATKSCVTALITGININFTWFSCNKNPVEVVMKYVQRGVTTILNHKEMEAVIKLLSENPKWDYGYCDVSEITGSFNKNHPFFRVDSINLGIRYGSDIIKNNTEYDCSKCYRHVEHKYYTEKNNQLFI